MAVPVLGIIAAGVTGLAGLSFASVLGDDDSPITAPPTSTNPDNGADNGGLNVSLLAWIAGFIALLVFGRTVIQEVL